MTNVVWGDGLAGMEAEMHSLLRVPLCLMMFCFSSHAQEQGEIGRGVLCDTAQQVQRFVMLRDNGNDMTIALQTVNDEAHQATACNFVLVMFNGAKPIAEVTMGGKLVSIIQISVIAFGNGRAWRQVPEITQYTAVVEKGRVI